ncbi:hypothetical protein LTR17_010511 [Elasticomyces elasticus]|nr:hypothetical protein LTR17_010511 [Elasticomyces elasticus]
MFARWLGFAEGNSNEILPSSDMRLLNVYTFELADVPSLSRGREVVMSGFRQSAWFTRGWTLQELLVPRFVIFLNKDWEVLGHKCAHCTYESPCKDAGDLLNNVLAEITGISEDIMSNYQKSINLGVDEKMGWMANRITTKTEDMAYCLIGIFDVKMSLLYGEGKEAMGRLERKIASRKGYVVSASLVGTKVKWKMERTEEGSKARMMNVLRLTARPASGSTEQPVFSCQHTECVFAGVSYTRKANLKRHLEERHGNRDDMFFDCEVRSCHRRGNYGFKREFKMREHMIMVHRNLRRKKDDHDNRDND